MGARGAKYICWNLGNIQTKKGEKLGLRDLRDLRLNFLKEAAVYTAEMLAAGEIGESQCEEALDYLYAELNRRLNKNGGIL